MRRKTPHDVPRATVAGRTALALIVSAWLALAACGGSGDGSPAPRSGGAAAPPPLSVVVLGIRSRPAKGSTTGYVYSTDTPNEWYGTDDPRGRATTRSATIRPQTYGDVLAPMIEAKLTKFACTGSTYDNGIAFDRRYGGTLYRPAQFGNWLGQTNLNQAYDDAKPDVVIITLGADDVSFADIFTFCATGYTDAAQVAAIATMPDRSRHLKANFASGSPPRKPGRRAPARGLIVVLHGRQSRRSDHQPLLGSHQQRAHRRPLQEPRRGDQGSRREAGKVPRIIFTTYHQPLPNPGQSDECLDMGDIERDETNYLISLQNTLEADAHRGGEGVGRRVRGGYLRRGGRPRVLHERPVGLRAQRAPAQRCEPRPFHPTPQGQAAIAAVLKQSFAPWRGATLVALKRRTDDERLRCPRADVGR